ncbi:MAG: NAD(P)-binding domain-containing protein [Candidatus Eremiobacterota bacterium]
MNTYPILIIGGGPGGLSLACELGWRKVPYLLLERTSSVGNTFRTMAANTSYGPWLNNALPHTRVPWTRLLRRCRREEFAQYLSEYAISNDLACRTGVEVLSVNRDGVGFRLTTAQGELRAPLVVNATGYFSNPYTPRFEGAAESGIPQMHAASFREPETVRNLLRSNRGRILVVGKRLTAGETMQALHRAGYEVALSHRSPIDFGPSDLMEACMSPLTFLLEETLVRLPGSKRPENLNVRMNGGEQRRLVETGAVPCFPEIARFGQDTVTFVDGREARFDLVIYATGYRPALKHLEGLVPFDPDRGYPHLNGMECRDVPGLFFLGLIGLRTFRSQFLRGLREDAGRLADTLADRVKEVLPSLVEAVR